MKLSASAGTSHRYQREKAPPAPTLSAVNWELVTALIVALACWGAVFAFVMLYV